jgi:SsrA-binding protein
MSKPEENFKVIAKNRRAKFDYEISETLEAGLILRGSEVKSLRVGQASIAEAYAGEMKGEIYLINAQIPEYRPANRDNHEPKRHRQLLFSRKQRDRLIGLIKIERVTLVPMTMYFNHRGIVKISIGIGKGKKKSDKRQTEKDRDWKRDQGRLMREHN